MQNYRLLSKFIIILLIFWGNVTYGAGPAQKYTVQYGPEASAVKGPSLKKATLILKLYALGNPIRRRTVTTDDEQAFSLHNRFGRHFVVEVISIKGSAKSIRCHGIVHGSQTAIKIVCHKRPEKHY